VFYVVSCLIIRAILRHINKYLLGSIHISVMCVRSHSVVWGFWRHIKHINIGKHPYDCDVYRVSFIIKKITHIPGICVVRCLVMSNLKTHQHVHSGELPCTWYWCNKLFSSKNHQEKHQHLPAGEHLNSYDGWKVPCISWICLNKCWHIDTWNDMCDEIVMKVNSRYTVYISRMVCNSVQFSCSAECPWPCMCNIFLLQNLSELIHM